jgi:hypothetical protein
VIVSVVPATCESCGRAPARRIVVRRHVGLLFLQRFVSVRVNACRPCGRGLIRSFTGKTLWQGWWGAISFFFNWFVLATNLRAWRRLAAIENPSLSGDFSSEPITGFDDVESRPPDSEAQPKRRFRLRNVSAAVFLGFIGLGLVASAWDATHHDHEGGHGIPAQPAALDLAMSSGPFTAEDGSSVGVKDAVCTGDGEAAPGGYTHFTCALVFADGTNDEVTVHLLADDELFFVSAVTGTP